MSSKTTKTGTLGLRRGKLNHGTHGSITLLSDPEEQEQAGPNASLARVVWQGKAEKQRGHGSQSSTSG